MICIHRKSRYSTETPLEFFPGGNGVTAELLKSLLDSANNVEEVYHIAGDTAVKIWPTKEES